VTSAPFRAEVVGSLLRPRRLREAREEHAPGRLGAADFKRVDDAEVDRAIALQQDAGLEVVTDGEMRRAHFTGAVSETVDGLGDVPAAGHDWHGGDELRYAHQRAVTGRLRRRRSLAQEEFVFARARASAPVKVTLPSPLVMQTFWSPEQSTDAYADPFEMFADAAAMASGGYETLSKEVFGRATGFETFLLEYDDERSGGFEPLADLPRDRVVVLGLVSTKRTEMEDADTLLGRIEDAARFSPRDQLAVSPQRGCESAIGDYPLDEEQQERKLRLVADVAGTACAA
jgi:methionine synthase II (cobalamin-independent)